MRYLLLVLMMFTLISPANADSDYLIIPKLNLYEAVELVMDSDLSPDTYYYDLTDLMGVGRLENLTWGKSDGGRSVLVGHTPGVFEHLHELVWGDVIILKIQGDYFTFFVVDSFVTSKEDGSVIYAPAEVFEVVLITCTADDKRLVIKAQ